eukprot:scaffold7315_cov103-Isochrysis_galbana.AAC.5
MAAPALPKDRRSPWWPPRSKIELGREPRKALRGTGDEGEDYPCRAFATDACSGLEIHARTRHIQASFGHAANGAPLAMVGVRVGCCPCGEPTSRTRLCTPAPHIPSMTE